MNYASGKISKEVVKWVEISKLLESEDLDAATLLDTLDGETELFEALEQVGLSIMEDQMALTGLKEMLESLTTRKNRSEKAIKTKRDIILLAMERANIPTIKRDLFTFSIKKGKRGVIVTDETDIPSKFWTAQDPCLDKKALSVALAEGEEIGGAELNDYGFSLSMRIK